MLGSVLGSMRSVGPFVQSRWCLTCRMATLRRTTAQGLPWGGEGWRWRMGATWGQVGPLMSSAHAVAGLCSRTLRPRRPRWLARCGLDPLHSMQAAMPTLTPTPRRLGRRCSHCGRLAAFPRRRCRGPGPRDPAPPPDAGLRLAGRAAGAAHARAPRVGGAGHPQPLQRGGGARGHARPTQGNHGGGEGPAGSLGVGCMPQRMRLALGLLLLGHADARCGCWPGQALPC